MIDPWEQLQRDLLKAIRKVRTYSFIVAGLWIALAVAVALGAFR